MGTYHPLNNFAFFILGRTFSMATANLLDDLEKRKSTLLTYPAHIAVDVDNLAQAGYFYKGIYVYFSRTFPNSFIPCGVLWCYNVHVGASIWWILRFPQLNRWGSNQGGHHLLNPIWSSRAQTRLYSRLSA